MIKEYAEWRESNGQPYLEVVAQDPFTAGLLQGKCLVDQIRHMKHYVLHFIIRYAAKRQSYKKFRELARKGYEKFFPSRYIEEMNGVAEGARVVDYDDILVQNCFSDIIYGHLIPDNPENPLLRKFDLGCTAFGIINTQTSDNIPKTLIGQNFDYPGYFRRALSFVHLKSPDKPEVFALRLGGMLCLAAGRNSCGIALTVNAVKARVQADLTMPVTAKARLCLETANSAEMCYKIIFDLPIGGSCNFLLADNTEIIATEVLSKHSVKQNATTTIVKSNTYVTEQLQQYLTRPNYSKQRQFYATGRLDQMYENKGGMLNDDDLLELLRDQPIICRKKRLQPKTIAFITRQYFGTGNPVDNPIGRVPF
ncbi:MAG: hypothetical protein RBG13Loki_2013 [Promethearchaeota archaeon CR_4]|nr:MAG: hypothetical protein RBG13Loki_2013 [Candidatus Lokiarchaeota archaeon CR_4]